MLQEEIYNLIGKIERELLQFVAFIRNLEEEQNELLSDSARGSRNYQTQRKKTSKNTSIDDDESIDGSAVVDAINIVKNVLMRISNLLDEFSSLPTKDERNLKNNLDPYLMKFYSQYVYQIASYLVKTVEGHLENFSERLNLLASPEPETKGNNFNSFRMREIQTCSNAGQSIIEALFPQDDRISKHPQTRNYKSRLKAIPQISDSEDDIDDCETQEILIRLGNLVEELLKVVEIVLRTKHPRLKSRHCCTKTCSKCCEGCKRKHRSSKFKKYEEHRKLWSDWDENTFPNLFSDPYWLVRNPTHVNDRTGTSDATLETRTKDTGFEKFSHRDRMSDPIVRSQIENSYQQKRKSSGDLRIPEAEPIKPGKHTRKISRGKLPRAKTPGRVKKRRPRSRPLLRSRNKDLPPGLTYFVDETFSTKPSENDSSSTTSGEESDTLQKEDLKVRKAEKNWIPLDESILIDKTKQESPKYPNEDVQNIHMFSRMLKEKLTECFSRSPGRTESSETFHTLFNWIDESLRNIEKTINDGSELNSKKCETCDKSSTTEEDFFLSDLEVNALVNEMIEVAGQLVGDLDEEAADQLDANAQIDIFASASATRKYFENLIPKVSQMLTRRDKEISQACGSCLKLIVTPNIPESPKKKTLKGCCFRCWNSRDRGWSIHQCHNVLPAGVLEIRHMDETEKACVCFLRWDVKKEKEDWRWMRSPFHDPTRVELAQQSSAETDTILKVIYGPGGNMVKESLAETQLRTVNEYPSKRNSSDDEFVPEVIDRRKTSLPRLDVLRNMKMERPVTDKIKEPRYLNTDSEDSFLVTKLGRLFDELRKAGCCKGPPLVLKLRRRSALTDAHNLLMVNSKIRLCYYRSLRVIFISENGSMEPSKTNFIDEDESDELFGLLARNLFSPSHMRLFEYPSQETQYLCLNPEAEIHQQWFEFAGVVLGLSIIHHKKLDVCLAMCFLKCLLDRPIHIKDLKEIDPLFYQRLKWMKDHRINNREMKYTFTIKDKIGGRVFENELMPNGRQIPVSENNKYRYIDLSVKWKLAERYLPQLKDFRRGFETVLDPSFLSTFSEKELQNLVKNPPDVEVFYSDSGVKRDNKPTRRGSW